MTIVIEMGKFYMGFLVERKYVLKLYVLEMTTNYFGMMNSNHHQSANPSVCLKQNRVRIES